MKEFVEYRLENMLFAVSVFDVFEVIMPQEKLNKIPGGPEYLMGITDIRGNILPIVDMRVKFGFTPQEKHKKNRIIILKAGKRVIGCFVDEASRILRIPRGEIKPPPSIIYEENLEYIEGVIRTTEGKLVILLNYDKVFEEKEIITLRGVDKKLMKKIKNKKGETRGKR